MSPANEPMLYKAWLRFSLFTGECRGFVGVFNTAGPLKTPSPQTYLGLRLSLGLEKSQ